jgi:hypothetical protein
MVDFIASERDARTNVLDGDIVVALDHFKRVPGR